MGDFSWAVAAAKKLIDKNGMDVTLRRSAGLTAADPSKPWLATAGAPTDEVVTMVFLDYEQKNIDGTNIQMGDQRALLAAADATAPPSLKDVIVRNGVKWNIISCKPLAPAEQDILYEVQVRR